LTIVNRSIRSFLTILTLVTNISASAQALLQFDSSKIAIMQPNNIPNKIQWPFDSSYKPATLTQTEFHNMEELFIKCVNSHNNALTPEYKPLYIDLNKRNFRKQLVIVSNSKHEKEVWVNCLCKGYDLDWRTYIHSPDGFRSCYFSLKINLATNYCYSFW